jgi:predicted ferric reductase
VSRVVSIRSVLVWTVFALAVAVPVAVAATSPLLAWRDPVYIASGFAGIFAMALVLAQPLLVGGYLPGLAARQGRRIHRWIGVALVVMVFAHVLGLWLTSAPDVADALLFASPTPFSVWGVVAMWATFAAALLAVVRGRLPIGPQTWRVGHATLATVVVVGSVVHAWLVEGTMGTVSKAILCILVLVAMAKVLIDLRIRRMAGRRQNPG